MLERQENIYKIAVYYQPDQSIITKVSMIFTQFQSDSTLSFVKPKSKSQSPFVTINCQVKQAPKGHGSDFFKDCPLNALLRSLLSSLLRPSI